MTVDARDQSRTTAPTRILNVDDAEVSLYTKSRILRHAGFEVSEAVTGNDALQRIEADRPALVLLDVRLPDISGTEVCRVVKERWPTTMVLQTSATYVTAADRTRGLEGGADSYLIQPIDPAELVAEVKALLRLHSAEENVRRLNTSLERRIVERTSELRAKNVRLVEQMAQRERMEATLVASHRLETVQQLGALLQSELARPLAHARSRIRMAVAHGIGAAAEEELKDALASIDNVSRLAARFAAGDPDGASEAVDLTSHVNGMLAWLEAASGTNIEFVGAEASLLVVQANPARLDAAILNLVVNVRGDGALHDGLTIALRRSEHADSVDAVGPGPFAIVVVARGAGIDDAAEMETDLPTRGPESSSEKWDQIRRFAVDAGGSLKLASATENGASAELWLRADPH